MIDRQSVTKWLQKYIHAWKTYDREEITSLFSENADYRYNPYDKPLHGQQAIVESWLESPDAPDSFSADYKPVAVEGDTAVSNGRTLYYEADGKTVKQQFDNIFVMQFDQNGRCADFCEWFMQPRKVV